MNLIKTKESLKEKYQPDSEKLNIVLFERGSELSNLHKAIDLGKLQKMSIVKSNAVDSLYSIILEQEPDIVILHIISSEIDWLRLIPEVKEIRKDTKIIIYSAYLGRKFILKIMGAGAIGYVAENEDSDDLIKALNVVNKGGVYLSNGILIGPDEYQKIPALVDNDISFLSERECDVIRLIGEGLSTKEIAFDLVISTKTVETY